MHEAVRLPPRDHDRVPRRDLPQDRQAKSTATLSTLDRALGVVEVEHLAADVAREEAQRLPLLAGRLELKVLWNGLSI